MEPTPRFSEIASRFQSQAVCGPILAALEASNVIDTDELMDIVRGKSIPEATAFLENWLKLPLPDASALAGVLLASSAPGTTTTATAPEGEEIETYSMSNITQGEMLSILKTSRIAVVNLEVLQSPHSDTIAGFVWGDRTEPEGTPDAVNFLREKLVAAGVNIGRNGYKLVDVHDSKNLLNVSISDELSLSGSSDVLIVPHDANDIMYSSVAPVLFELKTTKKMSEEMTKNCYQLMAEIVAARYLSEQPALLCVLTDLNMGGVVAVTTWNSEYKRIVIQRSELLPIGTIFKFVHDFLENYGEPNTCFLAPSGEGYNPKYEQIVQFKRVYKRAHEEAFVMEQFEELMEGTSPYSRDRALAVRHLFQAYGEEAPRCVSDYSHMYI